MSDGRQELDEITTRLIESQQICPHIPRCTVYQLCNRPDLNALYYTTHFCGDRFIHCQVYKTRQETDVSDSKNLDQSGCSSRASPS
jgi:hypothetical protein